MQALLSGCSAGGLTSILHCDNFRSLFPVSARVKCLSDAGFFINAYVNSYMSYLKLSIWPMHIKMLQKKIPAISLTFRISFYGFHLLVGWNIGFFRKDITGADHIKAYFNDVVTTHVSFLLVIFFLNHCLRTKLNYTIESYQFLVMFLFKNLIYIYIFFNTVIYSPN